MGEILKKPYELSIWEDRLVTENGVSYFKEFKIAVLGSDSMTSPNKAREPVLTENVNGEKTLTFSLAYKYYDEYLDERVDNPLIPYLVNERKIKLHYNDKWYDFVIKTREESSEEDVFTYTARELFIQELSKVGYNITLDRELNNNQGTIIELAEKVLEDTDWEVDKEKCDLLQQLVREPLYIGKVTNSGFTATKLTEERGGEPGIEIEQDENIYIFYSYISNGLTLNVQFLRDVDRYTKNWTIDENNGIIAPNYRFDGEIEYIRNEETNEITAITYNGTTIELLGINTLANGYRLVYGPLTTYDPIMERTVEVYEAEYNNSKRTIYHYADYDYVTSDVVTSFVTNGSDFNIFNNGTIQGWSAHTLLSSDKVEPQPLTLVTNPPIDSFVDLKSSNMISTVEGYLQMKFHDVVGPSYQNTYFNSGITDNASRIDHISAGEEFVLRTRFQTGGKTIKESTDLTPGTGGIRAIVAEYTVENHNYLQKQEEGKEEEKDDVLTTLSIYRPNINKIVLDFDGEEFIKSENIIDHGHFSKGDAPAHYLVDTVIQVPSTLYTYVDKDRPGKKYIWNTESNKYTEKTSRYADYYYTTATAKYSYSNSKFTDPTFKLGIFLYVDDENLVGDDKYIYLQDVQLTRCYRNSNGEIYTIGNAPISESLATDYFYLKPEDGVLKDEINTYGSLDFLSKTLNFPRNKIKQVYNEDCEKISSIQESNSNIFNILQTLCETFECWLDIEVAHDDNGAISLDSNHNPIKRIAFKKYAGKDNFAGFKYGINLESIQRTFESDELVTKLIVDPVQSEYSDTGSIDIQRARSNPSGASYLLNFSYYQNQGLIDVEESNKAINELYKGLAANNAELRRLADEEAQQLNAIDRMKAEVNTYTALIEEAQVKLNEALVAFEEITNMTYEEFVSTYNSLKEYEKEITDSQLPENSSARQREIARNNSIKQVDSVKDTIAVIYTSSATINNYNGYLENMEKQLRNAQLKYYGVKEIGISVTSIPPDLEKAMPATVTVTVDDYVPGLIFTLYDENSETREYVTTYNDRIFEITSTIPYKYLSIKGKPKDYDFKVFGGTSEYTVAIPRFSAFYIYDGDNPYTRRFKLVPTDKMIKDYPGIAKEREELIEANKALEKEFYKKYSRFIQEGTWSSQDYIDPELYYLDAVQVSNTSAQPKVEYTINVVDVSEIPGLRNYYFNVGDKTYIEDVEFFGKRMETGELDGLSETTRGEDGEEVPIFTPVREEVIVSEVEWHLDEPESNVVTVRNYKTRFEDLFQRISAAVQTVQYNEATYAKTSSILDASGLINSDLLTNSIAQTGGIPLTTNGSIVTTPDGIMIQDLTNLANRVKIIGRGVQLSTDGGNNWNTVINAEGLKADALTAGKIDTQQVRIMDGENPSFRWDKSGLSSFGLDSQGNNAYDLSTYVRFDKYGLYGVKNDADYVASSLDDVRDKAFFGITWDGFFIKNSYTDGSVSITSDEDFQVTQNGQERIKIGAIDKNYAGAPTKYGIRIKNSDGTPVFETGDDGNVAITGTINATAGNFTGQVTVGADGAGNNHIVIDGNNGNPLIKTSNYADGAGEGWIIDGNGDATFSNVSVRGSIKTAVFEYEEIQAVGGAFLFRPSSVIKTVRQGNPETLVEEGVYESADDLYVTVEKPLLFRVGSWCKVSNYNDDFAPDVDTLTTLGLSHIYKITYIDEAVYTEDRLVEEPVRVAEMEMCLQGAAALLDVVSVDAIVGGSLLDFGVADGTYLPVTPKETDNPHAKHWYELSGNDYVLTEDLAVNSEKTYYEDVYQDGKYNYGIGINSSDNYVNLPARAISLFETTIHPDNTTKVTYNYRGILGTLPTLPTSEVDSLYNERLAGTQGIYTDNMYLGDATQYLTFYTDANGNKQLKIKANQVVYEVVDKDTGRVDWHDVSKIEAEGVPGPAGKDAIYVAIDSTAGNFFQRGQVNTYLIAHVYSGGVDITNQFNTFYWYRRLPNGERDPSWSTEETSNLLEISTTDVDERAVFVCEVAIS